MDVTAAMKESVTVVIPAYNAESTLEKAVQSVLAQTVPVETIIIVNDGSKDGTLKLAESLKEKSAISANAPEIKIISTENSGVSHARNTGIKAASTEFIAFLDSDDSWHAEKIEKQLQVFAEHKDAALVSTSSTVKKSFKYCKKQIHRQDQINRLLAFTHQKSCDYFFCNGKNCCFAVLAF